VQPELAPRELVPIRWVIGKPRYYFRRPGFKSVPLRGLPWSPEFMEAYKVAINGECENHETGSKRTVPGTVNAAIISYYNLSADFRALADGTQTMRRAILERFREEHGDKRIAALDQRALGAILAKKSPAAARNWLKTLRGLLRHSILVGVRQTDPSLGIKLPSAKSNGHHSWQDEEVAKFTIRHPIGTRPYLAIALLLCTGQRRGDVVRMGRQHIRDGILSMRQQKTGAQIDIPVLPELQIALDALPKTNHNQLVFLQTEAGNSFTAAGFGGWLRDRCDEAGLPHCSAHGLRKAAATRLANEGATEHQLMAWFGWSSTREAERYTRTANRKRLAESAGALISGTLIDWQTEDPVCRKSPQVIEKLRGKYATGDPGWIRTSDPQLRRLVLYPAELRGPLAHHANKPLRVLSIRSRC
jgi:integrase